MGPQRDRGCDATPAAVSSETRRMSLRSWFPSFPFDQVLGEAVWLALKDGFYIAYDCHNTKLGAELARKLDCRDQRFAPRSLAVPMAFLPGYDIALAGTLVSGADLWLNTPHPLWRRPAPAG